MRPGAVVLWAAWLGTLAGCGAPSPELLEVQRTGTVPGARLKLAVSDGGRVRCNDGKEREVGSRRLLEARRVVRELEEEAREDAALAAGPNSVYSYRVRLEDGTVRFSDTSPRITEPMRDLQALTRSIAREVCGLAR